jgi:hypothetical protein
MLEGRFKGRYVAGLLLIGVLMVAIAYFAFPRQVAAPQTASLRAALVDQLGIDSPDPEFIESAVTLMEKAGFDVDTYGPKNVTVSLYAALPLQGYDLIIFRVHSGVNEIQEDHPVGLYTAEPYNEYAYQPEQLTDLLAIGRRSGHDAAPVFAVTPKFIKERSATDYGGAVIVLMGCFALYSAPLPRAFIDRGASMVIGWKGLVSADHTDGATLILLRLMLLQNENIADSVSETMTEAGADPVFGSHMGYYPLGKGRLSFFELAQPPSHSTQLVAQHAPRQKVDLSTWRFAASSQRSQLSRLNLMRS